MTDPAYITIPGNCKPSKAVSPDKTRPRICDAYLRKVDDGYEIHATDTYLAVRVPVRVVDGEAEEGSIPAEALARVEKGGRKTPRGFEAQNGHVSVDGGRVMFRRQADIEFPNLLELSPDTPKRKFRVGLNAKLLRQLADAIGSETVVLEFDLDKLSDHDNDKTYLKPIVVTAQASDAHGLLMPVRLV